VRAAAGRSGGGATFAGARATPTRRRRPAPAQPAKSARVAFNGAQRGGGAGYESRPCDLAFLPGPRRGWASGAVRGNCREQFPPNQLMCAAAGSPSGGATFLGARQPDYGYQRQEQQAGYIEDVIGRHHEGLAVDPGGSTLRSSVAAPGHPPVASPSPVTRPDRSPSCALPAGRDAA